MMIFCDREENRKIPICVQFSFSQIVRKSLHFCSSLIVCLYWTNSINIFVFTRYLNCIRLRTNIPLIQIHKRFLPCQYSISIPGKSFSSRTEIANKENDTNMHKSCKSGFSSNDKVQVKLIARNGNREGRHHSINEPKETIFACLYTKPHQMIVKTGMEFSKWKCRSESVSRNYGLFWENCAVRKYQFSINNYQTTTRHHTQNYNLTMTYSINKF